MGTGGLGFLKGMRAILSGTVLWRSGVIGRETYPKFEVIAKEVGGDQVLILKLKTSPGDYTYDALLPEHAIELGQALIAGAERLNEARS